jgi:glucose/mannose-6-phosphate isomerase
MITHEKSLLEFEQQIKYALNNFNSQEIPTSGIQNIVLCGLGGSGIGGRIARGFFNKIAKVPVEVYSDYFLPNYVSTNTLVVVSSYSGNTEETLEMFDIALAKGCKIVGICSGGALQEKLMQNNFPYFTVPKGYQPRMALGFSLTYNLLILGTVFGYNVENEIQKALKIYEYKDQYIQLAQNLFEIKSGSAALPILIFTDEVFYPASVRFCQQVQENAKGQAFTMVVPECNHNVTESIYGNLNANILFLNSHTNDRNNKRFDFLRELLIKNNNQVLDLAIKNDSLQEIMKTIYVLDWLSIKLSDAKQVDNMSVPNIDKLKIFLAS